MKLLAKGVLPLLQQLGCQLGIAASKGHLLIHGADPGLARVQDESRNQTNGNKSNFLALRHRFEANTTAANRTSYHSAAPLRSQNNGNKSQILTLGNHFEATMTATDLAS